MTGAGPRDPLWWARGPGASGGARARTGVGFTDRGAAGPDPAAPYGSGNLARHVGDDDLAVSGARARLAQRVGVAADHLLFVDQVHGTGVAVAEGPWTGPAPRADVLVTGTPGVAVAVMVADCVPVVLGDAERGVVGVAHAGRAGLAAGVVGAALSALHDLGARSLDVVVGPSICPRCYEVPAAMRAQVAAVVPTSAARTRSGTPSIDLASGVLEQLAEHGALVARTELLDRCTAQDPALFSYRRDGVTGRFAGVAWVLPEAGRQ